MRLFSDLFSVFLYYYVIQLCFCENYLSSFEISKFLETERTILNSLNGYIDRQRNKGVVFSEQTIEFVADIQKHNNVSTKSMEIKENPISVFHSLSRAVNEWSELEQKLSCTEEDKKNCPILTGADIIDVVKRRNASTWPTEEELRQAAVSILNIWTVYDLDIEKVLAGSLGDITERALTADDIFYIANVARDAKMTYEAITWFEYLLQNLEAYDVRTFKTSTLYRRLAFSYKEKMMLSKAKNLLLQYQQTNADDNGVARDLDILKASYADDNVNELTRFSPNDRSKQTKNRRQYEELCKSSSKGLNYSINLQCSLVPMFNSYGYAKLETISKRPLIEVVYDVLTDEEAERIITYGTKSFSRHYELFPFQEKSSVTDNRLKSGPMCEWNQDYPLMRRVTAKLERMTKYHMYPVGDVTSSECYMMTNEGSGVLHTPTTEAWPLGAQPYPFAGNRLATIMIQLSDVEFGGSLVFPKLNIAVPIYKGSAIIWRNLREDGRPSTRSVHTSCPVVVGSQWALFKNILYSNQLFRRPCVAR